jgi:hypothetical protein
MGGFFLDSIFRLIAKSAKSEHRANDAATWLRVDGKTSRFTFVNEVGNRARPLLVYSYEIGGETFYGSATGSPIGLEQVNQVAQTVDGVGIVHVRYDPSDLGSSRLLNQDNPNIPFEIDHAAY